jgi:hypothetical protein
MTEEQSLIYDTDKFKFHKFFPFYDKHFSTLTDVKDVLEIGIHNGGSLKFLSDYFPNAHIVGVDVMDKSNYNEERITTIKGNQENREELIKIDGTFDLIIDDGGHTMRQQQTTFGTLFGKVKRGGIFVIEDLHTSTDRYHFYKEERDLINTLDMVKQLQSEGTLTSNYITDEEKEYILTNMGQIEIFTRTECYSHSTTCVIYKKY